MATIPPLQIVVSVTTAKLVIGVCDIPDPTGGFNETIANNDDNVTYEGVPVSGDVLVNDADPTFDTQTFSGFDDGGGAPVNYVNTGTLNDISGVDES